MRVLWAFWATRVCHYYHNTCKGRNNLGHQMCVPALVPIRVRRCRLEESAMPQRPAEVRALSSYSPSSPRQDHKEDSQCPSQCRLALQHARACLPGARGIRGPGTEREWCLAARKCLEGDETYGPGAVCFTHSEDSLAARAHSSRRDRQGECASVSVSWFQTCWRTRPIPSVKEGSYNYSYCSRCT